MREYLNSTIHSNKSWLVCTIRDICSTSEPDWILTGFCSENLNNSAKWNAKILKSYKYDYCNVVADNLGTCLIPGIEFRNINATKKIWGHHRNWDRLHSILREGSGTVSWLSNLNTNASVTWMRWWPEAITNQPQNLPTSLPSTNKEVIQRAQTSDKSLHFQNIILALKRLSKYTPSWN